MWTSQDEVSPLVKVLLHANNILPPVQMAIVSSASWVGQIAVSSSTTVPSGTLASLSKGRYISVVRCCPRCSSDSIGSSPTSHFEARKGRRRTHVLVQIDGDDLIKDGLVRLLVRRNFQTRERNMVPFNNCLAAANLNLEVVLLCWFNSSRLCPCRLLMSRGSLSSYLRVVRLCVDSVKAEFYTVLRPCETLASQ